MRRFFLSVNLYAILITQSCALVRSIVLPSPLPSRNFKAEKFDDLLKTLPQSEEALNSFKGDLGKLLSRILAKSPTWNYKGTKTAAEDRRVDAAEVEYLPPHMVVGRNSIKISSTTRTTLTSPRTLDVWTYRSACVYSVDPKLITKVIVLPYFRKPSPETAVSTKETVFAIRLVAANGDRDIDAKDDVTTITHFGSSYDWDTRDRSWEYGVTHIDIVISCKQEAAVAIGRALKTFLGQKGGKVSFEDESKE